MIIDEGLVTKVGCMAKDKLIDESFKDELKQAFPGSRFTICSADDINSGRPVHELEGCAIYLVGSGDHCLSLTNDFSLATGVVIAELCDDE